MIKDKIKELNSIIYNLILFLNIAKRFMPKSILVKLIIKLKKNTENSEVILLNLEIPEQILDILRFSLVMMILSMMLIRMNKKLKYRLLLGKKNYKYCIMKHSYQFQIRKNKIRISKT